MLLAITMNPAIDKVYSVDDFAVDAVFRPRDMTATAGGKGLNVARVAYLLGESVTAAGLLGGNNGQFISKEVQKRGIISEFMEITGETRICINITDQKNTTSTEILENGPIVSRQELENFLEHYNKLLDGVDVVTASGSLPEGIPVDFYKILINIAKSRDKKFILDSSGEYLVEGIKSIPYMIKPNQDEVEQIAGQRLSDISDYIGVLWEFKKQGIELPVISLGRNGCLTVIKKQVYHFKGPLLKVKNTVGSGDSFIAGCAVALSQGRALIDVIKLGMACGAANTQFFKTGMVSKELVDDYFEEIECVEVN
ncbi:hexose kinase [Iocasia frigidifontis]|uniref:Tagatose-6-phosphate kinase n=1 Tax=Iocasia fonsfrigidae TaxID=2682810 RepID=A0A8A7KCP6_9FIRM|nr:1-phosphofructokinase family hexose kinase [Iocasia fonsfrigidae]QTL99623.1 hexose kinase [Iocasia fonsfrigidae]